MKLTRGLRDQLFISNDQRRVFEIDRGREGGSCDISFHKFKFTKLLQTVTLGGQKRGSCSMIDPLQHNQTKVLIETVLLN